MTLLRRILLATVACTATAHSSTGLEVSAEVADASVAVGTPLVLRLTVQNTGDQTIDLLDVSSSSFTLTHYLGMVETGCSLEVYVTSPDPGDPRPPLFGFTWLVESLAPNENRICEIELPATVISGTETITIYGVIDGQVVPKTAFTYSIVSASAQPLPQPVPINSHWAVLLLVTGVLALSIRSAVNSLHGMPHSPRQLDSHGCMGKAIRRDSVASHIVACPSPAAVRVEDVATTLRPVHPISLPEEPSSRETTCSSGN